MPVVNTIAISQRLESVLIMDGGAVAVTVKYENPEIQTYAKTFQISQEEALPFWGALPTSGINRWEDLCGLLYNILVTRGDVVGTVV